VDHLFLRFDKKIGLGVVPKSKILVKEFLLKALHFLWLNHESVYRSLFSTLKFPYEAKIAYLFQFFFSFQELRSFDNLISFLILMEISGNNQIESLYKSGCDKMKLPCADET
jgi:hypothetical protein